mmetsp:Transcript_40818/g.115450  ORF Transcript_40818/g.115450 Transcript_40818/m.115450 type:complete len:228 (+) Transcript_40818:1997-2680(+)
MARKGPSHRQRGRDALLPAEEVQHRGPLHGLQAVPHPRGPGEAVRPGGARAVELDRRLRRRALPGVALRDARLLPPAAVPVPVRPMGRRGRCYARGTGVVEVGGPLDGRRRPSRGADLVRQHHRHGAALREDDGEGARLGLPAASRRAQRGKRGLGAALHPHLVLRVHLRRWRGSGQWPRVQAAQTLVEREDHEDPLRGDGLRQQPLPQLLRVRQVRGQGLRGCGVR